jgi:hypothetical protein
MYVYDSLAKAFFDATTALANFNHALHGQLLPEVPDPELPIWQIMPDDWTNIPPAAQGKMLLLAPPAPIPCLIITLNSPDEPQN